MNEYPAKIKTEITITEDNKILIDFGSILENIPEETRNGMAEDVLWYTPIWAEIERLVREGWTGESYNGTIHKLRQMLIQDWEAVPEMLRNFIRGILSDLANQKKMRDYYRTEYFRLYQWDHKSGADKPIMARDFGDNPVFDDIMKKLKEVLKQVEIAE